MSDSVALSWPLEARKMSNLAVSGCHSPIIHACHISTANLAHACMDARGDLALGYPADSSDLAAGAAGGATSTSLLHRRRPDRC